MNKYKDKYIKYKKICTNILKKELCFDFYFMHHMFQKIGKSHDKIEKEFLKIIKDGYLRSSSETNNIKLGGDIPLKDIYMNIYFPDLNNLNTRYGMSLILSPLLMFDNDIRFRKGWQGHETNFLRKSDSIKKIEKNIREIKEYIKNPEKYKDMYKNFSGEMTHELVTSKNISLEDHLLGIICYKCNKDNIKKILKGTKIENIKIYIKGEELPTLKELLE